LTGTGGANSTIFALLRFSACETDEHAHPIDAMRGPRDRSTTVLRASGTTAEVNFASDAIDAGRIEPAAQLHACNIALICDLDFSGLFNAVPPSVRGLRELVITK
jgi:hypothetical protein